MNPYTQAYTFANPFSQRFSQSLQKSMLSSTLRKNKKSSPLMKNKTLLTHYPSDKKGKIELIVNMKGMSLVKNDGQLLTKAKIKRAESANLKGIATNKLYRRLTVTSSEMPASF